MPLTLPTPDLCVAGMGATLGLANLGLFFPRRSVANRLDRLSQWEINSLWLSCWAILVTALAVIAYRELKLF